MRDVCSKVDYVRDILREGYGSRAEDVRDLSVKGI